MSDYERRQLEEYNRRTREEDERRRRETEKRAEEAHQRQMQEMFKRQMREQKSRNAELFEKGPKKPAGGCMLALLALAILAAVMVSITAVL